jgi:hypothetical protein
MRLSVLCLSLCISGVAAAQSVPAHGFDHTPLGQAQLSLDTNGNLIVSNIGSSGLDGVRADLIGSDYYTVAFGAADTQRGDFMSIRTDGNVAGANQPIWALDIENLGTSFGVTMAPGAVGAQTARVLAWNDGELVADTPVDFGPGIIIIEVPPFGCDVDPVWPMGPIGPFPPIFETWALFDLEQPGLVDIPSGFQQALSVVADRVAIAVQHDQPIGSLSNLEMKGKNISQFEICAEQLGWKHHGHTALGNTVYDISNGFLTVANIGSSGQDGVCIDLDPLVNQTTDNGLRVPMLPKPIGNGQGMALQAFGTVQGDTSQLGTSEIKQQGGPAEVFAEFSALGGTQVCVMGLLDGQVVLNTIVPQGAIGAFQEPVVLNSCGKLPPDFEPFPPIGPIIIIGPQPPCFLWGLEGDTDLEIYNGFDYQGSSIVTVDELRLLAVDVPPVDGLLQFDITGTALGQVTLIDEIPMHGNAWIDLGCADPGTLGDPVLGGWGTLTPGSQNQVGISNGLPLANGAMFLTFTDPDQLIAVPFKGGTLKAFPFLDMIFLATDAAGELVLPFQWPTGLPSGVSITLQVALQDPGASKNVALTNAIQGTSH